MHSKANSRTPEPRFVELLNRTVDFGLASVLLLAPLAMAGRFAGGRIWLIFLVGVTAIVWGSSRFLSTRRQTWIMTGAEWLAGLAVFIVVLQCLPLPTTVIQNLSPAVADLLPLHHGVEAGGEAESSRLIGWMHLSLAPHATRGGLAMVVCYVLLFGVASQRIKRRADVEQLLKLMAIAGVSMAVIGLAQRIIGNGKFLWFMEHPSRDTLTAVKGTFANENHFVHFLALSLGPLLWWVVNEQGSEKQTRERFSFRHVREHAGRIPRNQVFPLGGLFLVSLAALLSFSRGGLVMMALAGAVTLGLFLLQRRVGAKSIAGLGSAMLIAMFCVWIHGRELLVRELETLQTTSLESLDQNSGRRKIWTAVLTAVPEFPVFGSGVGSHRYIYPTYFKDKATVQYTHAESGYLQVLLESGGLGFTLLLFGIGISGFWIVRTLRTGEARYVGLAVPLASGWAVSVVHATFDFNWFIPANMCMTLFVAAAATRLSAMAVKERTPTPLVTPPRLTWAVVTSGFVAVVALSFTQYIGPARGQSSYSEYRAWSLATNRFKAKSMGPGRQRSLGFVDPASPETTERMIDLLDETLRQDPRHGRAHIRMAALCLRQFDLRQRESDLEMDLAQIRDAALQSEFDSHQEMVDWVMRVVGDNDVYLQRVLWHAKTGIQLTPTEGSGYLYLGEVAFLDKDLVGREHELLHQAFKVRPYDPSIQFVHGRHVMLSGNERQAFDLWKDAFRRGSRVRKRVISAITGYVSVEEIVSVFEPDLAGLRDLFEHYRRSEMQSAMAYVGEFYVAELERQAKLYSGMRAGQLWFDAQFVHATLGNLDDAVRAAENAVLAQPSEYRNHYACALRLRDAGQWEDAAKQFRWCQQRKPENKELPIVINELKQHARQAKATTEFQRKPLHSASLETVSKGM